MNKLINDILTGIDRDTYDIGKLLWIIGVIVFLGLSIASVIEGQQWSPSEYGIGMGAVLAGGGAALGFKKGTEPNSQNQAGG